MVQWSEAYEMDKIIINFHIDNDSEAHVFIGCYNKAHSQEINVFQPPFFKQQCEIYSYYSKGEWHRRDELKEDHQNATKTNDEITMIIDMDNKRVQFSINGVQKHTFENVQAKQLVPIVSLTKPEQSVTVSSIKSQDESIKGDRIYYHFPVNIGWQQSRQAKWIEKEPNKISEDKLTATICSEVFQPVNIECQKSQYYIEFVIQKLVNIENLMFQVQDRQNVEASYDLNGSIEINQIQQPDKKVQLNEKDKIGVYIDGVAKCIAFYVNNVQQIKAQLQIQTGILGVMCKGTAFVKINQDPVYPPELDIMGLLKENPQNVTTKNYGYKFKILPSYSLEQTVVMLDQLSSKHKEKWTEFQNRHVQKYFAQADDQLVQMIDLIAQKIGKDPLKMKIQDLKPKQNDLLQFTLLEGHLTDELKERFAFLQDFNSQLTNLLAYVNLSIRLYPTQLQESFIQTRNFLFRANKDTTFQEIISLTHSQTSFIMKIDRTKAGIMKSKGKQDLSGTFSVFGQVMRTLQKQPNTNLRDAKQVWESILAHEGAQDAGGVFNEILSNLSEEMQSDFLPLLVQTPNQIHNVGTHRDCWMINPNSVSNSQREMWICFGKILGISIRTQNHLNLSLPPLFWKHLTLDPDISRNDLKTVDECICQTIQMFENIQDMTEESFNENFTDLKFTTKNTGEKIVELVPNGSQIKVTIQNASEFAKKIEQYRLNEGKIIYEWIRMGMSAIIPLSTLNLFTWKQVEFKVCGPEDFAVSKLRENIKLDGWNEKDDVVKWLWEILEEITSQERAMFLRFVWGRSKLPQTFRSFTITRLNRGDEAMPISHTCFFQLDLPAYTKKEILKQKLLYAIYHCTAIDLDHVAEGGFEEQ